MKKKGTQHTASKLLALLTLHLATLYLYNRYNFVNFVTFVKWTASQLSLERQEEEIELATKSNLPRNV